jgi:hypothetical protein
MELIIVMGAMAMLMGLAVGYLGNVGQATLLAQARAILSETAYRCVNGSTGGRRAILTLRRGTDEDGDPVLRIGAALARPILTHQFETLDFASGARQPSVNGKVEVVPGGGRVGHCARFHGGHLEFPRQSVFAPTEGFELDVWVRPEPRHRMLGILRGEDAYEVILVQAGQSDAYDVRILLNLREVDQERRTVPVQTAYETSGGPLEADGRWSRLQIEYDAGLDKAHVRVNGLSVFENETEAPPPGPDGSVPAAKKARRIAVGESGALAFSISSAHAEFFGDMDGFQFRGVFRSQELEREIPGALEVITPPEKDLPVKIVFANGALDPDLYDEDQVLRFRDLGNPQDKPLRLTLGMYGTVSSEYEKDRMRVPGEGPSPEETK